MNKAKLFEFLDKCARIKYEAPFIWLTLKNQKLTQKNLTKIDDFAWYFDAYRTPNVEE